MNARRTFPADLLLNGITWRNFVTAVVKPLAPFAPCFIRTAATRMKGSLHSHFLTAFRGRHFLSLQEVQAAGLRLTSALEAGKLSLRKLSFVAA